MRDDMPKPTTSWSDYASDTYIDWSDYPDDEDERWYDRRSLRSWGLSVVSSALGTCIGVVVLHFVGLM